MRDKQDSHKILLDKNKINTSGKVQLYKTQITQPTCNVICNELTIINNKFLIHNFLSLRFH